MGSFADAYEAVVLDHVFGLSDIGVLPSVLGIRLTTTTPTDAADGTEQTGTGYTAQDAGANWTRATSTITNDNNIDFGPATAADWGAVLGMGIHTALSAGTRKFWDDFGSVTINNGDTARFTASTGITVTLD